MLAILNLLLTGASILAAQAGNLMDRQAICNAVPQGGSYTMAKSFLSGMDGSMRGNSFVGGFGGGGGSYNGGGGGGGYDGGNCNIGGTDQGCYGGSSLNGIAANDH